MDELFEGRSEDAIPMNVPMNDAELIDRGHQEAINELAELIHDWAKGKGWWEQKQVMAQTSNMQQIVEVNLPPRDFPELVALIHTEVSEALEEYRKHGLNPAKFVYYDPHRPDKPEGIAIELADAVIRILDACGYMGINLGAAIRTKMAYNQTRPHRHGNKLA